MDIVDFTEEIENLFEEVIDEIWDLKLEPKFSYSYKYSPGLDCFEHRDLFKKYVASPYDELILSGMIRMEGDIEFLKLKSKESRILFLQQENLTYEFNWDQFVYRLKSELEFIKSDIVRDITLLKLEFLSKCGNYEITDFKFLILQRLDNLFSLVGDERFIGYLEDKDLTDEDPNDSYITFGIESLLENRFNLIANRTLWITKSYFGLEGGFPREELEEDYLEIPDFQVDRGEWLEMERHFQLILLYNKLAKLFNKKKLPANMLESKSLSIFEDNVENIFHDVLISLNAIDENNRPVRGKFQPICSAFYQLNLKNKFQLFKSTTLLKDFIIYLNKPDVYNANLKNQNKLSSGDKHYLKVKELVKIGMNRAFQI